MTLKAADVVKMASERGLDVQFELGKKHTGAFTEDGVTQLIEQGRRWLDAGALQLVVEARESAKEVGLFDDKGNLHCGYADRFAKAFGISAMEVSLIVKKSHFFCALPGFHDQLQRSRIEPPPPLLDQLRYAVLGKRSGMLLTQLELNIQASFARHLDHIGGF